MSLCYITKKNRFSAKTFLIYLNKTKQLLLQLSLSPCVNKNRHSQIFFSLIRATNSQLMPALKCQHKQAASLCALSYKIASSHTAQPNNKIQLHSQYEATATKASMARFSWFYYFFSFSQWAHVASFLRFFFRSSLSLSAWLCVQWRLSMRAGMAKLIFWL